MFKCLPVTYRLTNYCFYMVMSLKLYYISNVYLSSCHLNTLKLLFLYVYELETLINKLCLNVYMSTCPLHTLTRLFLYGFKLKT